MEPKSIGGGACEPERKMPQRMEHYLIFGVEGVGSNFEGCLLVIVHCAE